MLVIKPSYKLLGILGCGNEICLLGIFCLSIFLSGTKFLGIADFFLELVS